MSVVKGDRLLHSEPGFHELVAGGVGRTFSQNCFLASENAKFFTVVGLWANFQSLIRQIRWVVRCNFIWVTHCLLRSLYLHLAKSDQRDHLSGKPGNVREFDSCQGNVRNFTKCQGSVREKILSGKSCLKLFIVSCIFASIQVFSGSLFCVKY